MLHESPPLRTLLTAEGRAASARRTHGAVVEFLQQYGVKPWVLRAIGWIAVLACLVCMVAEILHMAMAAEINSGAGTLLFYATVAGFVSMAIGKEVLVFASQLLPKIGSGHVLIWSWLVSLFALIFISSQVLLALEKVDHATESRTERVREVADARRSIAQQQVAAAEALTATAKHGAALKSRESRAMANGAALNAAAIARQAQANLDKMEAAAGAEKISDHELIAGRFGDGVYNIHMLSRALSFSLMGWALGMLAGRSFRVARELDAASRPAPAIAPVVIAPAQAQTPAPQPVHSSGWEMPRQIAPAAAAAGVTIGALGATLAPSQATAAPVHQVQIIPRTNRAAEPPQVQTFAPQQVQKRTAPRRVQSAVKGLEPRKVASFAEVRELVLAGKVRPTTRDLKEKCKVGSDVAADMLRQMGKAGELERTGRGWALK